MLDGNQEETPQRFVYMVRLPRPEVNNQDTETHTLEASAQLRQERIDYLSAAMRVKQVQYKIAFQGSLARPFGSGNLGRQHGPYMVPYCNRKFIQFSPLWAVYVCCVPNEVLTKTQAIAL